jgi:large subunit ribosomal protein L18
MKNSVRTIPFRRKREGKTDYRLRRKLLSSKNPRLVIRKSLRYITIQAIQYSPTGDIILVSASSKELAKLGWKFGTKNTAACYLTGLLLAKKAKEKKITTGNIDLGRYTTTKGNKLFAAIKGLVDGGLNVPASNKIFPAEERLNGSHIKPELSAQVSKLKEILLK